MYVDVYFDFYAYIYIYMVPPKKNLHFLIYIYTMHNLYNSVHIYIWTDRYLDWSYSRPRQFYLVCNGRTWISGAVAMSKRIKPGVYSVKHVAPRFFRTDNVWRDSWHFDEHGEEVLKSLKSVVLSGKPWNRISECFTFSIHGFHQDISFQKATSCLQASKFEMLYFLGWTTLS